MKAGVYISIVMYIPFASQALARTYWLSDVQRLTGFEHLSGGDGAFLGQTSGFSSSGALVFDAHGTFDNQYQSRILVWDGTEYHAVSEEGHIATGGCIDEDRVAWRERRGTTMFDPIAVMVGGIGVVPQELTSYDGGEDVSVRIFASGGRVAWVHQSPATGASAFMWNGTSITSLGATNIYAFGGDDYVYLSGGILRFWNGAEDVLLAEGVRVLYGASINSGQVAFAASTDETQIPGTPGVQSELFYYDGIAIRQLTHDAPQIKANAYPCLYNGNIAWARDPGIGGDAKIAYWDGIDITEELCPGWPPSWELTYPSLLGDRLAFFTGRDDSVWTGTIIPEPATLSLLALGALALVRRRKR